MSVTSLIAAFVVPLEEAGIEYVIVRKLESGRERGLGDLWREAQ